MPVAEGYQENKDATFVVRNCEFFMNKIPSDNRTDIGETRSWTGIKQHGRVVDLEYLWQDILTRCSPNSTKQQT